VRLYSCPRAADKGLVNIDFFELICKSMSLFKCILSFKEIEKDYERFLVRSKKTIFDFNVALVNLEFHVHVKSEYICRQCHGVLKKRSNLQQNLEKIHENKLRHMFEVSWACFSAENFARRHEFEFEEASTRRPQMLIFDCNNPCTSLRYRKMRLTSLHHFYGL